MTYKMYYFNWSLAWFYTFVNTDMTPLYVYLLVLADVHQKGNILTFRIMVTFSQ